MIVTLYFMYTGGIHIYTTPYSEYISYVFHIQLKIKKIVIYIEYMKYILKNLKYHVFCTHSFENIHIL